MIVRLTQVSGQDYSIRNDALRRRNAEIAYNRVEKYNDVNKKVLEATEKINSNKTAVIEVVASRQEFEGLGAGQMKQVSLPIGKTLEETIDLWRDVRTEAISVPEPTTADYQLAATASSKIRQAETDLGLHQHARSQIETTKLASVELPSTTEREMLKLQKRYEHAISSYSVHVQMQKRGFEIDIPSFYKVA